MILGIDASNISSGGGLTHLIELLRAADPKRFGFSKVLVWAPSATLESLHDSPWLVKYSEPVLEGHFLVRAVWQRKRLGVLAKEKKCDLLFVPGGVIATKFHPVVTMNQNLLPFELTELLRFGWSRMTIKWLLLRWIQIRSLQNADGAIFLTNYARDKVIEVTRPLAGRATTIPHGIDGRFFVKPRKQPSVDNFSFSHPFKIVYTSTILAYKHQWHVVEAIAQLRREGFPIAIDLIGAGKGVDLRRLKCAMNRLDPNKTFSKYCGVIPYSKVSKQYENADLAVFASSCETFGQILTEYMAHGLPIACSNRSSMPDTIQENCIYFDPEDFHSIANAIRKFILSPELRAKKSEGAYELARNYSWERCATETFCFLEKVADQVKKKSVVY